MATIQSPVSAALEYNDVGEHRTLKNPLILHCIFKKCSLADIKSCRLVSKFWACSTLSAWQRVAYVKASNSFKLIHFVNFVRQNDPDIFANLSIRNYANNHSWNLWTTCGQYLKVLHLSNCLFENQFSFRQALFRNCHNLEELCLHTINIGNITGANGCDLENRVYKANPRLKILKILLSKIDGVSWTELFRQYPSINVLHLANSKQEESAFAAFNEIRQQHADRMKLTELRVYDSDPMAAHMDFPPPLKVTLLNGQLALERLSMCLPIGDNACVILAEILFAHKSTLKSLELYNCDIDAHLDLDRSSPSIWKKMGDALCNLQGIKLITRMFKTLSFLKLTPNLKKLSIYNKVDRNGNIIESTDYSEMEQVNLANCTELELCDFPSVDDLKNVSQFLPNVKRLKVPLDNAAFACVCQMWTELESLDIYPCEVNDSGFTGLDIDQVDTINRYQSVSSPRSPTVPMANISCLKRLKTISFARWEKNIFRASRLTYCAMAYGFEPLPCLRQINADNYMLNGGLWIVPLPNVNISLNYGMPSDDKVAEIIRRAEGALGYNWIQRPREY